MGMGCIHGSLYVFAVSGGGRFAPDLLAMRKVSTPGDGASLKSMRRVLASRSNVSMNITLRIKPIIGPEIVLVVSSLSTVRHVKKEIMKRKPNVKCRDQQLVFRNETLLDEQGIGDDCLLHLLLNLKTSIEDEEITTSDISMNEGDASERSSRSERGKETDKACMLTVDLGKLLDLTGAQTNRQVQSSPLVVHLTVAANERGGWALHAEGGNSAFDIQEDESEAVNLTSPDTYVRPNDKIEPKELARYRHLCCTWNSLDLPNRYSSMAESWQDIQRFRIANKGIQCALCDRRLARSDCGKYPCEHCKRIFCIDHASHQLHNKYFDSTD